MGADYMAIEIPYAANTGDRQARLANLAGNLTMKDLEVFLEHGGPPPEEIEDGREEECALAWACEHFRALANQYWEMGEYRDTHVGKSPGGPLMLMTGGMSWGDPPTESFSDIKDMTEVDIIYSTLEGWAKKDAGLDHEIEKTLVLSTIHISPATGRWLDKDPDSLGVVAEYDGGWRIFCNKDIVEAGPPRGCTPGLWGLVLLARKLDCTRLLLDRDGPKRDDLPQFKWPEL